ncbi:hypothetical protein SAMN02745148_01587 [Modicisalibacter ilicicola DSM 19980]|uniref:Uncharacterized protein n=1 Tax=Modicisalibacter ilicicola DSM 19980 TaxID=1121942 RepID=A0A1M4Y5J2_9GAMM|nr:hypothetical protein [Halomonas ilicicola]SHF00843.1 hypothetical protein SAMN02745148_01587 [Halomonas ilicicola DSM 19980]
MTRNALTAIALPDLDAQVFNGGAQHSLNLARNSLGFLEGLIAMNVDRDRLEISTEELVAHLQVILHFLDDGLNASQDIAAFLKESAQ